MRSSCSRLCTARLALAFLRRFDRSCHTPHMVHSQLQVRQVELLCFKEPGSGTNARGPPVCAEGHRIRLELTGLFVAVATEIPKLPQVRAPVEEIERLRTTWITRGPTAWPAELKKLPGIFGDCLRLIRSLTPARADQVMKLEAALG